jgi:hypothetical protein
MVDDMAEKFQSFFDDLTSGNLGNRLLKNFETLVFRMVATWIAGVSRCSKPVRWRQRIERRRRRVLRRDRKHLSRRAGAAGTGRNDEGRSAGDFRISAGLSFAGAGAGGGFGLGGFGGFGPALGFDTGRAVA